MLISPPDLIPFSGQNWNEYEDEIYRIYLDTVANAGLVFLGLPIKVKYHPDTKKKGFGFWHLISEAPSQNNHNEEDRIPDLRRCERIRWIAWCIQNAQTCGFSYWENQRGRDTNIVIWAERYDFAVIMAKRQTKEGVNFFLLKTAYCLRRHNKHKFLKEKNAWQQGQKD